LVSAQEALVQAVLVQPPGNPPSPVDPVQDSVQGYLQAASPLCQTHLDRRSHPIYLTANRWARHLQMSSLLD
jgi:hypothetical protein